MSWRMLPAHPTVLSLVFVLSLAFWLLTASWGVGSASLAGRTLGLRLQPIVRGLSAPVYLTHAGDGSGRLFIVEQRGRILVYKDGALLPRPFLDIQSLVSCCGERGLLSVAFHPRYEENGFFYVNYTDTLGDTVVARYSVSEDPDVARTTGVVRLLHIDQPFPNHNGGLIKFGPDGYLYVGMGDGGSGGDPQNNGQNLRTLLGKILRLDVDGQLPYEIPPTNPFVNQPDRRAEIWAWGLRNPWRFSFDRDTGDLYIADVGQNRWEEVNFQPATSPGGENYGWRIMEGFHCFNPPTNCDQTGLTLPIHEYGHAPGFCGGSVTGGYVYRGRQVPELIGTYIFGDYCFGTIWGLKPTGLGLWEHTELLQTDLLISSFGEDESGEVYVVDHRGAIYQITSAQ